MVAKKETAAPVEAEVKPTPRKKRGPNKVSELANAGRALDKAVATIEALTVKLGTAQEKVDGIQAQLNEAEAARDQARETLQKALG